MAVRPWQRDSRLCGAGWTYRTGDEMSEFDRPLEDPLVERLLIRAIIRINAKVTTEAQAMLAVNALRKTMRPSTSSA
jgi:type I restriction enzyme R subunit